MIPFATRLILVGMLTPGQVASDVSQTDLSAAFADVGERAAALARSNYAIGICTPVAFGNPSLTIDINVDGRTVSETLG